MPYRWQENFESQPADVLLRRARYRRRACAGDGRLERGLPFWTYVGLACSSRNGGRSGREERTKPGLRYVAATTTPRPANSSSKTAAAELPPPAPEAINDGKSPRQEQTLPRNTDATSEERSATTPALERTGQAKDTENWVTVETKADERALTLLNTASKRAGRDADPSRRSSPRDNLDQAGIEECERRYSSFRRSDGTYQPFGRSTREPCPFLR